MTEKIMDHRKPDDGDPGGSAIRTRYRPPVITSYSSEEILEQAGPAQACSPAPCAIF